MKRLFIILIIFISFTQINAYALPSDRVIYDNDYSKSTNVKEALDELYEKLKNDELELERINKIGNALPSEIVAGKTAYVNGTEVTGTMPTKEGQTYTPTTTNQVVNSGYYLVGDQIILGDSNLLAQNIRNGVSIFGVNGTFTSDANATAGELLKNKTAYVNGQKITGTIESKVAATYTPGTQNQTIASGQYLSGAQTITGDVNLAAGNIKKGISIFGVAGTFTGDANATAAQILKDKTAYVNGAKITGTIASKAAATYTPGTANQTIASGQYLSGVQTIKGDSNLTAANIKKGVSIFGVSGTYTSDANATAAQILKDKTAYVNGAKITGTIASKGAATITPGTSNQTISSGQYLSGVQTIKGDSNLTAANIKKGVSIFGVAGNYVPSGSNAGIHITASDKEYCGTDWYLTAAVSAGTYIVTNVMYVTGGTGNNSNMNFTPGACNYGLCSGVSAKELSVSRTNYNVVQTYLVTLSKNFSSGAAMGRMSVCSDNLGGYMYGKSTWTKIA